MKKILYFFVTLIFTAGFWSVGTAYAAETSELSAPVITQVKAMSGSIKLSWSDDEKSAKTIIYRKKVGGKAFKRIGVTVKDTYKDTTAQIDEEYVYCVKSFLKEKGTKIYSEKSESVSAVTNKPKKVAEITGTHSGKENYILIQWDEVEGADKYQIFRSESKNGTYKRIAAVGSAVFEDTTVKNNKIYYYKIRTVNTDSGKNAFGSYSSKKAVGSYGKANFIESNGMVYALKSVKIRKAASSSSAAVATLRKGYSAVRIAESDNGWTKVIYKNKTRYINSKYLTEERMIVRSEETGRIIVNPEQELWNLVVVNHSREISKDYKPVLDEIFDTGKMLDERVVPYYEAMYKAAKEDGLILRPVSGYRSYERQKELFDDRVREYMDDYDVSKRFAEEKVSENTLPPGTSEHNLGLAIDIGTIEGKFGDSKQFKWLKKNAHKYGFILRYTEEKTDITGIINEPWHWRFVGTEYAEDIKNSGLCLEEYLEMKGIAY